MSKFLDVTMQERVEPKVEQKAEKKRYDWRFENSINKKTSKVDLDSDYSKWRINNILSTHWDSVKYANEMNINYDITDQMHYDYLFGALRKGSRYTKPESKEEKKEREREQALISLVSAYYKYNRLRAKEAIKILSAEQIEYIKQKQEKGGVS